MRGLAFTLAVSAALACACGSKLPCANCAGCCDSNGACTAGTQLMACGAKGAACVTCLPGQICQAGACVANDTDGGDCGPATCTGCCSASGCQTGNTDSLCGVNGATCASCSANQHCGSKGDCESTPSCSGCRDTDGSCLPGNTNLRCGGGGIACTVCGGGTNCRAGACQAIGPDGGGADGGATDAGARPDAGAPDAGETDAGGNDAGNGCGPGNCAGCCTGPTCVQTSAQTISACGVGGAACTPCAGSLSCQDGACLPCTGDRCRQSDGSCVAASNTTCGGSGTACVDCTNQAFATMCGWSTKTCSISGFGIIGSSCSGDYACFPGPNLAAPYCRSLWPEGFCEDLCDTQGTQIGSCAFNAFCLPTAPLDGGDYEGVCMRSCTAASDCAHDAGVYLCDNLGGGIVGYCAPACSTASQCQAWFGDARAGCATATQHCCGIKNLSCCPGNACFDGTSCQFTGYCG